MSKNARMKELREEFLDMTQEDFAEELGLQRNSISLIENGKRNPSKKTIEAICFKFNVNKNWFETGEGDMFLESHTDEQLAYLCGEVCGSDNEVLKRTFFKVCKLNDKYLTMFEKMLDTLLEEE